MTSGTGRKSKLLVDLLWVAAAQVSAYYLIRWLISYRDPEREKKKAIKKKSDAILRRLDSNGTTSGSSGKIEKLVLNSYEQTILTEVVAPEDIHVSFKDIGGLDPIIEELRESVIYPLTLPGLFSSSSSLLSAPKGVLLYGPPGCGKTMLARALARESGACFINLHISTLTEKWYGDSNKLVTAVFSLAKKLQPTIVFIDEIDAVLRSRSSTDHEASTMVKAEFMTHWDGLLSTNSSGTPAQIMILGATNRIQDIDEAILRRMPKKFPINLPDMNQRKRILGLILKDTKLSPEFNLEELVEKTAGMSGSDLTEACRDAAMVPVREYIKTKVSQGREVGGAGLADINKEEVRGVENRDFFRKGAGGRRPVEEEIEAFGRVVGEVGERLGKANRERIEEERVD
ncbi:P-loop containing nucleoside triphosphate hydrolase protein [Pyronema domesticum]|uniref:Similar to Protein MSP1 acc. no. P28737 n=1 Tax=Pyronema omphalodes (strain CBS 100304) TaxID=1076935 RepID=U4LG28_PYROM|nr:P-loop containing nucleoside triphosphate hydrolase protein [Pyronema domesticum]CCX14772.1 Similar to Protein MSP1; acc. no. P28737 [Pyronema omphalodes CBS 100304]